MEEKNILTTLTKNINLIIDCIKEIEKDHYNSLTPDVSCLLDQIYWAAKEVKDEF